ncbi:MAG: AAA family ATPase [Chloroflexi bacterium]|nr:AAA family ATPase [Chloroflexota bacterium]
MKMVNWRAYQDHTVRFDPGLTLVIEANGIGKTSILEAISYGLTGEPATLTDRRKLLRSRDALATVTVEFTVDARAFVVKRSRSPDRAGDAVLMPAGANKPLAATQRTVTEAVERLMEVSVDFLRGIVYMAEGDVCRFLNDPPRQALGLHLQRVLGLNQLNELVSAMREAEKQVKGLAQEIAGQLEHLRQIGVEDRESLYSRMRKLEEDRETTIAALRSVQEEITVQRRADQDRGELIGILKAARSVLREDPALFASIQDHPIFDVFAGLEKMVADLEARINDMKQSLARLDGERVGHQRVLEVLAPLIAQSGLLPCPVCGKPLGVSSQ